MMIADVSEEMTRGEDRYDKNDALHSYDNRVGDDAMHCVCSSCLDGIFDHAMRATASQ